MYKQLLYFVFLMLTYSSSIYANNKICGDVFTCASLEDNVNFWIKVSSIYESDSGVIHARSNLNIYKKLSTTNKKIVQAEKQAIAKEESENIDNIRFQRGFKNEFIKGIERSFIFKEEIQKILKDHGINKDLFYLTLIESAFDPFAVSKAGAHGVWQITNTCWKDYLPIELYFLSIDPIFASFASAQLLRDNLNKFNGDYPLAITAYNYGTKPLLKAIKKFRTKNIKIIAKVFDDNKLGFAVRNFYASFLAARFVGRNLFRNYTKINKNSFVYVISPRYIKDSYKKHINMLLNPVISKLGYIPKFYPIRSYKGGELSLITFLKQGLPNSNGSRIKMATKTAQTCRIEKIIYKIKKGDNLISIAKKNGVSLKEIMKLNNIKKANRIYVGQKINITSKKICKETQTEIHSQKILANKSAQKIEDLENLRLSQVKEMRYWALLYDLLLENKDTLYFITDKDQKPQVYTKNSINILARPPLPPSFSEEGVCKNKVSDNELFKTFFYNEIYKKGVVYLAPWESLDRISTYIGYDLYLNNNIPKWIYSLKYRAIPLNFRKISPKELMEKRESYYLDLLSRYFDQYSVLGDPVKIQNKGKQYYENYPSYILYRYNKNLLFKDIKDLKEFCLPKFRVNGSSE